MVDQERHRQNSVEFLSAVFDGRGVTMAQKALDDNEVAKTVPNAMEYLRRFLWVEQAGQRGHMTSEDMDAIIKAYATYAGA